MSRGCPYGCTYCGRAYVNKWFRKAKIGQQYRFDVSEQAIQEIKYVKERYGVKWVRFFDGSFNANASKMAEFLELYKQHQLPPFMCYIRTEHLKEEMVEQLKSAGCERVSLGIQSGSQRIRRELSGRRTQTDENIRESIRLFNKHNIRVNVDMILGWPEETIEESLMCVDLLKDLKVSFVSTNVLYFYPGTDITQYAADNGFIDTLPNVFDLATLTYPNQSQVQKTPDIKKILNVNGLLHYMIKYNILSSKFLRDKVLSVKPNRFYLFIKDFSYLSRSIRYDAKNFADVIALIKQTILSALNVYKDAEKRIELSERTRKDMLPETQSRRVIDLSPPKKSKKIHSEKLPLQMVEREGETLSMQQ